MKKKRIIRKSMKHSYKKGAFEAGMVKNSKHPRNNIYLRIISKTNQFINYDFTIDEAAAIISVLGCAIMDYTNPKRNLLSPPMSKKEQEYYKNL